MKKRGSMVCLCLSLLMAIQISRVIERSSIWMPSARDVTRSSAIFLSLSLSYFSLSFSSLMLRRQTSFGDYPGPTKQKSLFLFPVNDSIDSIFRPRSISARRSARVPNGSTRGYRITHRIWRAYEQLGLVATRKNEWERKGRGTFN